MAPEFRRQSQGQENIWLLAFDFGGTKHSAALKRVPVGNPNWGAIYETGWDAILRVYSPPGADAQYDIKTMIRLGKELLSGQIEDVDVAAIGVSFGGPVDADRGQVRLSHHVPGWENTYLADILSEAFNAPVWVDNDANIGARGEYYFGAGQGCHSLMYITVSTGVGGGWFLEGHPWRGADSLAGEIGHTVVDPQGPTCLCGKRGCVERLASGPYMAQDARQQLKVLLDDLVGQDLPVENGGTLLNLAGGDPQQISGATISQAAAQGDQMANNLLQRAACALGVGIGNAANLVNPQRFILGGGVTKAGEPFWEGIRQAARQTAIPEITFEVLPAALGDDAPLWGALALGLEQHI